MSQHVNVQAYIMLILYIYNSSVACTCIIVIIAPTVQCGGILCKSINCACILCVHSCPLAPTSVHKININVCDDFDRTTYHFYRGESVTVQSGKVSATVEGS